jgi:cold shock CspA family protein
MPTGHITMWNVDRGFGFIRGDDASSRGDDFIHIRSMPDHEPPYVGDRFEFERIPGSDGRSKAINVRRATSWGDAAHL